MVAGRSTRSLDRMQMRWWLAVAVIAVWSDQAVYLWPLPSDVAAQSAIANDPKAAEALAWWESQLWLAWAIRIVAIPVGVASGILLLKNHRHWPVALFIASLGFFLLFRAWQWLYVFVPLLKSAEGASWLLERPQTIVNSVVFPAVLLIAAIYSGLEMVRRRREAHAI
jgi:hypothetical protein